MLSAIFQRLALAAIRAYQRWLSPHKGFVCAYRVHTGRDSCSAYGHRVIKRFGVPAGLALLRRRLAECGAQHRLHAPTRQPQQGLRRQAGYCDVPSCDLPGCDLPCHAPSWDTACNVADCGCDLAELWSDLRGKGRGEDEDNARQRALRSTEYRPEE